MAGTPERMRELLGGLMPNQFTLTVVSARLAAGNIRRRVLGVLLFTAGIIVQTVGNIIAV